MIDLSLVEENCNSFGVAIPDVLTLDRAQLRVNLLREELQELEDAIADGDEIEIRDALADIRYVLNGTILEFGLGRVHPLDFNEVHNSNQSKMCTTIEEAIATVDAYNSGTHPDKPGKIIKCRHEKVDDHFIILKLSDSKYLKSINYTKPSFCKQNI